ncbi:uncharacterized protein LOC126997469 [Eriocheir sinensis]|uniref:uncharacterized protein LOC126997469 n=1 Tax=Eriocheir sinensis TaxID=95602 RepID=UPI0021C88254|nr:uncharacterized protein LOC126997469 [Eriocheir sinensis]XP_050714527.1 uncharacterized protein LOC126997469 [Eriocheir sinensis]XP_050714528.1 uncharacterized protein LOC126997469 [Eriocheir sinensis]XP_050714529.1 uncharacterized protein LOC126997469 [Eriocheir sinensis]XP_050714530.1 uncharacterized protein LOC126997469 [Eriocheir sinensis]
MLRVGGWGAAKVVVVLAVWSASVASCLAMPGADPACGALGPGECMARTSKCKLVKELVKGKGGHVKPVLDCATTLGIPKMQVVGKIGPAFAEGKPETIVDRITNDSALSAQLHLCVYKASGLVAPDGTIARQAMINKLTARGVYTHPTIIDNVAAALSACPEPPPAKVEEYLKCVRNTCIQQMPPSVSSLPTFGLEEDGDDGDKKCKGKKCKKH